MDTPMELPARTDQLRLAMAGMQTTIVTPDDHGREPIEAAHKPAYVDFIETARQEWAKANISGGEVMTTIYVPAPPEAKGILADASRYQKDGSCPIGWHTFDAAYWSAQTTVCAADDLIAGEGLVYSLNRPPGHHARWAGAGGFCYFSNAAIGVHRLLQKFRRVAVLDVDMHHGQGTEEIFYRRNDVLTISIHADPTNFYPVSSGFKEHRGLGEGLGYNLNLPMLHGSLEQTFFDRLEQAIAQIKRFKPDVLVVPLGFDIYKDDPQSRVGVTTAGFKQLGSAIADLDLPTLINQEGGYHIESLVDNAQAFFTGLGVPMR
ncbi:MAG TPA: histone deacetylase family protein [Candidatus Saccharimonadales bacterium]|nr:histone deacetylase family protein [Candidatus Saccharimonadales bacterium]